jgi:rsbT co-antagonist protein RsbR
MAEHAQRGQSDIDVIRGMGITSQSIERRKRYVGITADDVAKIVTLKDVITEHVAPLTASFFDHLAGLEEARGLMTSRELEHAKVLKREHLLALVAGDYGPAYVEQRIKLGLLYGRHGVDARVFLGAFQQLLRTIGQLVVKHHPHDGFEAFLALEKLAFFDVGVIVDVLVYERERVIRQQSEAIRELSTPVLQIRDRMLLLPIIGIIDTHRAKMITENLLRSIRANRAKVVVMDVTGVATIDSKVANHLLQTVTAARLMGAAVIVTGLSADVAQSLVALGIELTKINTVGDLQGGLEDAERMLGYRVVAADEQPLRAVE